MKENENAPEFVSRIVWPPDDNVEVFSLFNIILCIKTTYKQTKSRNETGSNLSLGTHGKQKHEPNGGHWSLQLTL